MFYGLAPNSNFQFKIQCDILRYLVQYRGLCLLHYMTITVQMISAELFLFLVYQ